MGDDDQSSLDIQLKDESNFVIATARNINAEGLQALAKTYPASRLALIKLDVTKAEEIAQAVTEAEKLLPKGLDYFVSNAGIGGAAGDAQFEQMCVYSESQCFPFSEY